MIYSLLEIVQLILASMDSDEVNSITDTTESYQIALMAKSVYNDICVDLNLPARETLFQLNASGDATQPVLMTVPTSLVTRINYVQYDTIDPTLGETNANYKELTYYPFADFLTKQNTFRLSTSDVGQMSFITGGQTFKIMYQSKQHPLYYTTFNDNTIIFDSYRKDIDTTLQKSKTLCSGMQYAAFTLLDTFVPVLEPSQFSYFINKLKTRAFYELKQQENKESTAETRRQKIVQQKRKRTVPDIAEVFKVARYRRNSAYGSYTSILEKWGRESI